MQYTRMATSGLSEVTIPQLNGGLNVYDVPSRVADNQLTACNNLWWHRGTLRTRPGLTCGERFNVDTYTIRQTVDQRTVLLARFADTATQGEARFHAAQLTAENGFERLGAWENGYTFAHQGGSLSAMGIRARKNDDTRWYYLLSGGDIIQEQLDGDDGWTAAEPYIPTVIINGVGEECEADASASVYEDYNMLTRAFACHYTTDGKSTTWRLPEGHLATDLTGVQLESEVDGVAARIELDLYGENGLRTIEVEMKVNENGVVPVAVVEDLTADEVGAAGYTAIRMEIRFKREEGIVETALYGREDSANAAWVTLGGLPFTVSNNLRITAWRGREHEEDRLTICRMTRGTWYGGDRSGIEGGTRFFVCGNPDEPDLLCWSGIEHPLYFPEHNRVRVGDTHSQVTALGKQGSLLVIYKEHETYGMQYLSSDDENYDFSVSGGVAVTSYMATFVLFPINASVGCDCPDTVRLVNNRLVWACSDANVYMLTATNQYSERNVRMISRNVRDELAACGADALKTAMVAELEGYYLLMAGNRVFLMNTQTSAFASFTSYDDEERAKKAIPWYVWTLPDHLTYTAVVETREGLCLTVTDPQTQEGAVATLTEVQTDDGVPIPCHFATKLWDFGIRDHKKSIEQMYVGLRCADLPRLQVTYITDRGRYIDPYRMQDVSPAEEGYCRNRHLTPNVRLVQAFGVRLDSAAAMETDGITIKLRQQGVVR